MKKIKIIGSLIGATGIAAIGIASATTLASCSGDYTANAHVKLNNLEQIVCFRNTPYRHPLAPIVDGIQTQLDYVTGVGDMEPIVDTNSPLMLDDLSGRLTSGNIFNAFMYTFVIPVITDFFSHDNELQASADINISTKQDPSGLLFLNLEAKLKLTTLYDESSTDKSTRDNVSKVDRGVVRDTKEYYLKTFEAAPLIEARSPGGRYALPNISPASDAYASLYFGSNGEIPFWESTFPSRPDAINSAKDKWCAPFPTDPADEISVLSFNLSTPDTSMLTCPVGQK